jgi:hypothetical protein
VVEDVVETARFVAGVLPPVAEALAGGGNHPGDQDQQVGRDACADERRRESAERMADDDEVPALGDRVDHGAGVRPPAGRLLLARKIDGDGLVAASPQLASDQMPVPGTSPSTVDQRERRHDPTR